MLKCLNPECNSENIIEIGGVVGYSPSGDPQGLSTLIRCQDCGQTSWWPQYRPAAEAILSAYLKALEAGLKGD